LLVGSWKLEVGSWELLGGNWVLEFLLIAKNYVKSIIELANQLIN